MQIFEELKARGLIAQVTDEEQIRDLVNAGKATFYIGFDCTADSLTAGHFMALTLMKRLQMAGNKPIALIGGGTTMIGDPSGRTDMRQMMTNDIINHNCECFKKQMSKFFSFEGDNAAVMVNNADWIDKLNFIEFIRDIGRHFSVNQMLSAECFKQRMERGLSFLEFNYMPLQAYDFLYLYQNYGCKLECGGDDQWSNILAGANLIRVKEHKPAFAMTFQLLTTSEGKKMGKTQKGAVWLDPAKTSPYEFYQYWRNVGDQDVEKCLKLLTFMPVDEIEELCKYQDERINEAKKRLAYEVTKIVHSEEEAKIAQSQAEAAFGGASDDLPEKKVSKECLNICDILVSIGACKSKSEARSIISGGGVKIGDVQVQDFAYNITEDMLKEGFILHKGKKVHVRVSAE